jgi:tyrosinase
MGDPMNSVNDPLFFMHHGGMDYMWGIWQEVDPSRLQDLDASWTRNLGSKAGETILKMGIFASDIAIKEVADTQNRDGKGILCYKFEGMSVKDFLS